MNGPQKQNYKVFGSKWLEKTSTCPRHGDNKNITEVFGYLLLLILFTRSVALYEPVWYTVEIMQKMHLQHCTSVEVAENEMRTRGIIVSEKPGRMMQETAA